MQLRKEALIFLKMIYNCPSQKVCIENSHSIFINKEFRKPDQIIQPWMFGESFQKTTPLWLKGLPLLKPTNIVGHGEFVVTNAGKRKPKWYADSFKLNSFERSKLRSKTFKGIAEAMADQWSI